MNQCQAGDINSMLLTAFKMMVAAVITFIIFNLFHLQEGFWATVTVAAITQAGSSQTVIKSIMRLLGTLIGAGLGFLLAVIAHHNVALVLLFFFLLVLLTSMLAVQPTRYSYAAIISGLTSVIVLSSSLIHGELIQIAYFRTIEVLLGILVMFVINLLIYYGVSRSAQHKLTEGLTSLPAEVAKFSLSRGYLLAGLKIAVACTVTLAVWLIFRQPGGFWATISCLLIMEESVKSTQDKAGLRIIAHFLAAGFGAVVAVLLGGASAWWVLIPLAFGFFVCGFIIGGRSRYAGLGNTMGIALAIMLLVGVGEQAALHVVLSRFYNVLFGVVVAVLTSRFLHVGHFYKRKS